MRLRDAIDGDRFDAILHHGGRGWILLTRVARRALDGVPRRRSRAIVGARRRLESGDGLARRRLARRVARRAERRLERVPEVHRALVARVRIGRERTRELAIEGLG